MTLVKGAVVLAKKNNTLHIRILSSIVMILILSGFVYFNKLNILFMILCILCLWESFRMFRNKSISLNINFFKKIQHINLKKQSDEQIKLIYEDKQKMMSQRQNIHLLRLLSFIIIAYSFLYNIKLLELQPNSALFILGFTLLITVSTDTFAYIIGSKLKGKKLAPKISPNKTISGSLGGLITSSILGIIFLLVFKQNFPTISFLGIILLPPLISIFSQLGDLYESKMKRICDVKDSSNLIPGHGGVWDRLDSFIFASAFTTTYFIIFLK